MNSFFSIAITIRHVFEYNLRLYLTDIAKVFAPFLDATMSWHYLYVAFNPCPFPVVLFSVRRCKLKRRDVCQKHLQLMALN